MNSLMNYGSDDDYDDSSEEKQTDWRGSSTRDKGVTSAAQTDANYEEVQMELSEGSNDSSAAPRQEAPPSSKEALSRRSREERDGKERRRGSERDVRDSQRERDHHNKDRRSSRDKEGRSSRDRNNHSRRSSDNNSRADRDRDREQQRERERKTRRSSSRERRSSTRSSRTPPRRAERESRHSRSRSRSRDRPRKYAKRYERGPSKNEPTEKNERPKTNDEEKRTNQSEGDRFFMPGITGRFRDQIERRKQLWQKKDIPAAAAAATAVATATTVQGNVNGQSKKVWETTTFAQDTDGKVASKFKRLMGIRGNTDAAGQAVDVLRKQEEMFSSMEQQYEVARTATHTMRGVGLGFGSFQR